MKDSDILKLIGHIVNIQSACSKLCDWSFLNNILEHITVEDLETTAILVWLRATYSSRFQTYAWYGFKTRAYEELKKRDPVAVDNMLQGLS